MALTLADLQHKRERKAAKRRTRRKYVRIIMNDFMLNPGPNQRALEEAELEDGEEYGLMESIMQRWTKRLRMALAAGAGQHIDIPPGNAELIEVVEAFDT